MGRAPCCEKVGLKKGRWTAEEDEILMKYIQHNGEGSWRSLPKNAGLLRCGKSCRLRWLNYLRTDLRRGNISSEEETLIIKLHNSLGNRWSLIAGHLPGRTDNEIKNYWNSHLSRRIDSFRRPSSETTLPIIMNLAKMSGGCKRKGGKTSRAAMKKNNNINNNHSINVKLMPTTKDQMVTSTTITPHTAGASMTIQEKNTSITLMNSSSVTVQNEDDERQSMILDPYLERENVVFSSSSTTTTITEENEGPSSLGQDELRGINKMLLGPIEGLETEIMCPNDIIMGDDGVVVVDSNGLLTFTDDTDQNGGFMWFNEERESGVFGVSNIMTTSGEMTSSTSGGLSCNGGGGEQYNQTAGEWAASSSNNSNITSSSACCFEDEWINAADNWDWVGVVEDHHNLWEDGDQEMLSWLEH